MFIAKIRENGFIADALRRECASTAHAHDNIGVVDESVRENASTSTRHHSPEWNISQTDKIGNYNPSVRITA